MNVSGMNAISDKSGDRVGTGCFAEAFANILAAKQRVSAEGPRAVGFIRQGVKVSDPLINFGKVVF